MFIVPPYLCVGERQYSYLPLVIIEPERALGDRAKLPGAALFDRHSCARIGVPVDFPAELDVLAAISNLGVGAAWSPATIWEVAKRWANSEYLPDDLFGAHRSLRSFLPPAEFNDHFDGLTEIKAINVATLTKPLALARPELFPMIDKYVQEQLQAKGKDPQDDDWEDRDRIGFWLRRFHLLLRGLHQHGPLAEIPSPRAFQYTEVQKLDRLLWFGRYAAEKYFRDTWTVVCELPKAGFLSAKNVYDWTAKSARVVLPSQQHGVPPGRISYSDLTKPVRDFIDNILGDIPQWWDISA